MTLPDMLNTFSDSSRLDENFLRFRRTLQYFRKSILLFKTRFQPSKLVHNCLELLETWDYFRLWNAWSFLKCFQRKSCSHSFPLYSHSSTGSENLYYLKLEFMAMTLSLLTAGLTSNQHESNFFHQNWSRVNKLFHQYAWKVT